MEEQAGTEGVVEVGGAVVVVVDLEGVEAVVEVALVVEARDDNVYL